MRIRPQYIEVGPLAAIIDGTRIYRVVAQSEADLVLVSVDSDAEDRVLSRNELALRKQDGTLMVEEGYFLPSGGIAGRKSKFKMLGEYQAHVQVQALYDLAWAQHLDESRRKTGQPSLSHNRLTAWIEAEYPTILLKLRGVLACVGTDGQRRKDIDPAKIEVRRKNRRRTTIDEPGATALRDNLRKLKENNWDVMVLVPGWDNCTEGGRHIDPEVRRIVRHLAPEYATEKKPTFAGLRRKVRIALDEVNAHRDVPLSLPCPQTIARIVRENPEVEHLIGRRGIKAARQQVALVGDGPRYTRVGEHVFMDCWKMQVMSIYKEAGLWDILDPDGKEIIKPLRIWAAVLRDSASGCILGMSFSFSESGDAVRGALRMSLMDRTDIARYVGAESDWLFPIGFDCLETDGGSVFRSPDFWLPALSLIGHVRKAAGDHPRLRGGGERFFGTVARDYLPEFTGQTGANIIEKGDYDPQARASMVTDMIAKGLIRWTLDVHHLTKPKAPHAQQPRRKFYRLYNETGAKPAPTNDQLRMAFGIDLERELGRWGIRHANVMYYRSSRLEAYLKDHGPQTVTIKVDPLNIGQISVLLGKQWVTVGGPPELDGVGLTEWVAYNREMERRYLAEEALDWPTVARAIRSLEAMSDQAVAEAQIRDLQMTSDKMKALAASLKLHIVYDDDPRSHKVIPSIANGTLGQPFTPSGTRPLALAAPPSAGVTAASSEASPGLWGLRPKTNS